MIDFDKILLCGLCLIFFISCKAQEIKNVKPYMQATGSAWNLALGQADKDQTKEIFYGTYEGQISAQDMATQELIFSYQANAFPFSITTVDLDEDGLDEVLAATADGSLLAINHQGKLLWEFKSKLPLYNVAVGDIIPGGSKEIVTGGIDRNLYLLDAKGNLIDTLKNAKGLVHRVAVGNLDTDKADEILMIEDRTNAVLIDYQDGQLNITKKQKLILPNNFKNWENPRSNLFVFDLKLADLNHDSVDEIIIGDTYFNKQIIAVLDSSFAIQWVSDQNPFFTFEKEPNRFSEFFSTAQIDVVEMNPEIPGLEIVSITGGLIRIYTAQGKKLGEAYAKIGFTDLVCYENKIILGSSPNGDNMLYTIDLSKDWKAQILAINRQGRAKEIEENLMQLRKQVIDNPLSSDTSFKQTYTIQLGGVSPNRENKFLKRKAWMQKTFPYANFRYGASMKVMEESPPLNPEGKPWSMHRWRVDAIRGTMSKSKILENAAWIESQKIPTMFYIGHSCMPFISLSTAEEILKIAPNYCMGFQTAEDEEIERIPQYFEHFYKPLSNLCLQYGNKWNLTKNKGIWWVSSPSLPSVYTSLFEQGRKQCVVASTEDSNSRTPGLNILGRSSLWLAGLLDHIFINTNSDLFSFNRFFQWEYPKHGHPYLRRLITHTLLGGNIYQIRHMDKMETDAGFAFSQMGKESSEIFFHLLGKGLVVKPERKQVKGFNPIGFVVHPPSSKWLQDAHNGHSPEKWKDDPELHQAVIPHVGNLWGITNTPEHSLEKILFHKKRQFGDNIPATPYGLIAFVPVHTDLNKVEGVKEWWHTDGIYIWKDERAKYTGKEAAEILQKDFKKSSRELPFTYSGDDIFLQILKIKEDVYRLYLIDPGWLDPRQRTVELKSNLKAKVILKDALSHQEISQNSSKNFEIIVPAGALRIIEVSVEK